jgi:RNA polymerase sigma-70 factor (ECF subfamily)
LVVLAEGISRVVDIEEFLAAVRERLERALVVRFGIDDGLEAADEAVAYAVEHWDRVGRMDNPAGYVFRVGQSYGSRLRRRWRRSRLLIDTSTTAAVELDIDLQRALLRLSPEQRITVVLVHGHGHTYAEVAELLGVPATTITNHLNRGRARLRRILETQ